MGMLTQSDYHISKGSSLMLYIREAKGISMSTPERTN